MSLESIVARLIEQTALAHPARPVVVGICGSQGSGKSTLAAALCARLDGAVTLSLDDLYRTRADRRQLARDVHPLLATRGVPGTHDVDLGLTVLDSIAARLPTPLPRFSKAIDDRLPQSEWPVASTDTRVILIEGWCVGALPQSDNELAKPVNALEADDDDSAVWRRYVNTALAGGYQTLFQRLDRLILLAAPDWDTVVRWRIEQEHTLRRNGATGIGLMNDNAIKRFCSTYERLTRHILAEMPDRCDLLVSLDPQRLIHSVDVPNF